MHFWRWCILNLKADYPDVLFLAEAFTRPKRKYFLAKSGFTQGQIYFTWRNSPSELKNYLEELTSHPFAIIFGLIFGPIRLTFYTQTYKRITAMPILSAIYSPPH